jgi:hypothetical protein
MFDGSGWRGWGNWSAFDYFLDWLLYGFGHKGQPQPPEEKNEYQGAGDRLYQIFNVETLLAYPHDYFGASWRRINTAVISGFIRHRCRFPSSWR